jgi:hypothetical protein
MHVDQVTLVDMDDRIRESRPNDHQTSRFLDTDIETHTHTAATSSGRFPIVSSSLHSIGLRQKTCHRDAAQKFYHNNPRHTADSPLEQFLHLNQDVVRSRTL